MRYCEGMAFGSRTALGGTSFFKLAKYSATVLNSTALNILLVFAVMNGLA